MIELQHVSASPKIFEFSWQGVDYQVIRGIHQGTFRAVVFQPKTGLKLLYDYEPAGAEVRDLVLAASDETIAQWAVHDIEGILVDGDQIDVYRV